MIKFSFRGPIAAVFSPFNNDRVRSLNLDVIPGYAKFLADKGVKGVLVNGTTGEGMLQNVQERKLSAEKWMNTKATTRLHIMLQIGGAPLPDVLELAKHADRIGVDSLLCLPELFYRPTTTEELGNYLKMVGEAAPETPLLYYHNPAYTYVKIHMGQFLRAIGDKIPTFSGIKFTSEALDEGLEALNAHNKKFVVFVGTEVLLTKVYKLGFDSSISTLLNMFPQFGVKIHEYAMAGKYREAEKLQEEMTTIFKCIMKYGKFKTQAVKEVMNLFSPFNVGPPRYPMTRLPQNEIKGLEESVRALKLV